MKTFKLFEVGGKIRDEFLGLKSDDIDYSLVFDDPTAFASMSEAFDFAVEELKRQGFKVFQTYPDFVTIKAKFPKDHIHAGLIADFVLARKEVGYKPGTRDPICVLGTLEDDLRRRDFTVNCIAMALDGEIIDPFSGVVDINKKILRTPLDPKVTFLDDPLRLVRALRFSITKGFHFDQAIWKAMQEPEIIEKLMTVVSEDRIRIELNKMFAHDTPKSLKLLAQLDIRLLSTIFKGDLWLQPTTKNKS